MLPSLGAREVRLQLQCCPYCKGEVLLRISHHGISGSCINSLF